MRLETRLLMPLMANSFSNGENCWEKAFTKAGRNFGLNYVLYVPLFQMRGQFTIKELAIVLEDELSVQGNWSNYYAGAWLRLLFELDIDQMLAKMRFDDSIDTIEAFLSRP